MSKDNKLQNNHMGVGIAIGVAIGVGIDNIAVGIALGVVYGAMMTRKEKEENESDSAPSKSE